MTEQTGPRANPARFPLAHVCAFGPSAFAGLLFAAGFTAGTRAVEPFLPRLVAILALFALVGLIGAITGRRRYALRAIGALLNGLILAALAFAALGL